MTPIFSFLFVCIFFLSCLATTAWSRVTLTDISAQSQNSLLLLILPSLINSSKQSEQQDDYPLNYGRWGAPENIFTLPEIGEGNGYYYPDIQARFPEVDWQHLDRLYIPAGKYKFINIGNLPERSTADPLVITNLGGQVQVGGFGHYYLFVLGGGRNWILSGRYDPISRTGDSGYRGHWGGEYVDSRGKYGFLVDDNQENLGNSGISIGGTASDFELEFLEVREVGFAGMTIKTNDDGEATMENISIHDNYIHDTLSEGFYIGSTQAQPQHLVRDLELYNNRVIRTGTEAIQIGNLGGNVHVHHNVFALSAIHWKDSFQAWQDGNLQIGNRTGDLDIEGNVFIGAAGNMVFASAQAITGDDYPENSTVLFKNNYFSSTRNLFFYLRNDQFPGLQYRLEENYFSHMVFGRDEIDPNAVAPTHMIRTFTPASLSFVSNTWDVEQDFSNVLKNGNGTAGNVSGHDNIRQAPPALSFYNTGLPDNFDWLKVEVWAATAGRGNDQPISYEKDDIVMYHGRPYRCRQESCPPGLLPKEYPDTWVEMDYFPDDWRLKKDTGLDGIGLLY